MNLAPADILVYLDRNKTTARNSTKTEQKKLKNDKK